MQMNQGQSTQTPQARTSGLAIASLVCGVFLCVPLVGVPAVVLGIMGLRDTSLRGARGRGMAIAGLVLGLIGMGINVVMLFFVSIPFLGAARRGLDQARCDAQMLRIGAAIQKYASTNGGAFPSDLNTLAGSGLLSASDLQCPQSGRQNYVYYGSGLRAGSTSPGTALLDEPSSNHSPPGGGAGGRNVLYADGKVEFVTGAGPLGSNGAIARPDRAPPPVRRPPIASRPASIPLAYSTSDFVGTWSSESAALAPGQTTHVTVEFRADGTFTYQTVLAGTRTTISGRWSLVGRSILMTIAPRPDPNLPVLLTWHVREVDPRRFLVESDDAVETWVRR